MSPARVEPSARGKPWPNTTARFCSICCYAALELSALCHRGVGPTTSARTLHLLCCSSKLPLLNSHLYLVSSSSFRRQIPETGFGSLWAPGRHTRPKTQSSSSHPEHHVNSAQDCVGPLLGDLQTVLWQLLQSSVTGQLCPIFKVP